MKRDGYLRLVGHVRDMQIVDCHGARCGIADDLEFEYKGENLEIKWILVGPGAFASRLPTWAQIFVKLVAGTRLTRVPWNAVQYITSQITLEKHAAHYGLRTVEKALERRLTLIPGAKI